MSRSDQLAWEARWGRPAGIAALVAGALLLAHVFLLQSILEDRERVEPLPDFLLSIDDRSGAFLASYGLNAIAAFLLAGVFLYLFRAAIARGAAMPRWFVYFVLVGPLLYGLASILGAIDRVDLAEQFAAGEPIRGDAGDARAEDVLEDGANAVVFGFSFAGSIAVAFLFVMLPLRARRVGLVSPFMAILGVVAGALLVLQLIPLIPIVIQAFWLGALGLLFLGKWPGGRGPAWESGEAEPWPTPAQRRGIAPMPDPGDGGRGNGRAELDPVAPPPAEAEPVPQRPKSRKRRKKR